MLLLPVPLFVAYGLLGCGGSFDHGLCLVVHAVLLIFAVFFADGSFRCDVGSVEQAVKQLFVYTIFLLLLGKVLFVYAVVLLVLGVEGLLAAAQLTLKLDVDNLRVVDANGALKSLGTDDLVDQVEGVRRQFN